MVKPPSSKVRLDAAERRSQILATALPVFARFGFAGTSTRQIAAAAAVTEPILYRHFRDKAALFRAVLDLVGERLEVRLQETIAGARGARARLLALAEALPAILETYEDELRVLCGAAASHTDAPQTAATHAALSRVGTVLTKALAGPGLRPGVDAATAAYFLLEVGLGAALLRPVGVSAVTRRGFGDRVVALLAEALLPH